jgi:hypothetical protein
LIKGFTGDAVGINDSGEIAGSTGAQGFTATYVTSVTAGSVSGNANTPIPLGIQADFGENDPDSVQTIHLIGLPPDATLSDANGDVPFIAGDTAIFPAAQLAGLTLSEDSVPDFDLSVIAGTVDGGVPGYPVSATLHVDVAHIFGPLDGGTTVTGDGAPDTFVLASDVLNSGGVPTITNFHSNTDEVNLANVLFDDGSMPASNFVNVTEDPSGNSATLSIKPLGSLTFVDAMHLDGVHAGDVVTAVLNFAHATAQLTVH